MPQSSPGAAARPLSPHLQVWRWHLTLFCSIAHRATGMALYGGFVLLAGWAVALAAGPVVYDLYTGILGSLVGKVVLFGLTLSALYHLAAGIRHLVWDVGHGFGLKTAELSGAICIAFAVLGAIGVFVAAHLMGAL